MKHKNKSDNKSMLKRIEDKIKKIPMVDRAVEQALKEFLPKGAKKENVRLLKGGGLAEATAKLKAKGMKEGGMVVKDKTVAIDKSPNSGLITVKGFGAGRRT